jgi:hypothetical protein
LSRISNRFDIIEWLSKAGFCIETRMFRRLSWFFDQLPYFGRCLKKFCKKLYVLPVFSGNSRIWRGFAEIARAWVAP